MLRQNKTFQSLISKPQMLRKPKQRVDTRVLRRPGQSAPRATSLPRGSIVILQTPKSLRSFREDQTLHFSYNESFETVETAMMPWNYMVP